MLDIGPEQRRSKCYFADSKLPNYIDQTQPPSHKRRPFSTILQQPFNHTLTLTAPTTIVTALNQTLDSDHLTLRYFKLYMKPCSLLEEPFLSTYIKPNSSINVLMLSEGRSGLDNTFSVHEGLLRLEVNKPTFERLGLEGRPIPGEGRKHVKARYVVEVNLRLPSMVSGKKGFERVKWALKNGFDAAVTWLVWGVESAQEGPIRELQPLMREVCVKQERREGVRVPRFPERVGQDDGAEAAELLEWLSLVALGSTQVCGHGRIDPYLCRYETPEFEAQGELEPCVTQDLTVLTWHGLASADFALKVFFAALKASGDKWFAFNASSFDGGAYTILKQGDHTMSWEYRD